MTEKEIIHGIIFVAIGTVALIWWLNRKLKNWWD